MGWDRVLPSHVLKLMAPVDRKPLGQAGVTPDEAQAKEAVKLERELHEKFLGWPRINSLPYVHSRMDRKSTIQVGHPDFTVIHGGRVALVEFKAPGGVLSAEQRRVIAHLHATGSDVLVTEDLAEAIRYTRVTLGMEVASL